MLANLLENKQNIDLNGVILLSQIFNFTTDIDRPEAQSRRGPALRAGAADLCRDGLVPQETAQQPAALEPFLKEVEEFAMGPYAHALALGTDLSAEEKQPVAEKLHEYTGLPVSYLLKANLRVNGGEFEKTLQDDAGLDHGTAGHALLRAEPRSAERERGVRSADRRRFRRPMFRCSTTTCAAT